MERFKKILVSVDASRDWSSFPPHSVTRALRIARDTGASVQIVGTVSELPPLVRKLLDASDAELLREYEKNLHVLLTSLDPEGVPLSHAVRLGRPFVELIREVERTQADLLIRDISEDESQEAFFSGLDMRLVRNCPCPVWMVKRDPTAFEHIVAAIDPLSEREDVQQINRQILEVAHALAQWENGLLHVVGAVEGLGPHGEPVLAKLEPYRRDAFLDRIQATAKQHVRELVHDLSPSPKSEHVRLEVGNSHDVIRNYVREIDADVIVMGTVNRTTVPSMLVGNTAEQVLHTARSSVLCLKPAGFRSPVLS